MRVSELINRLNEYDPDVAVYIVSEPNFKYHPTQDRPKGSLLEDRDGNVYLVAGETVGPLDSGVSLELGWR